MNYRNSYFLWWVGFAAGFLTGFFSIPAGVVILLAAFVQLLVFYRCPECHTSLIDHSGGVPSFCPSCGAKLN